MTNKDKNNFTLLLRKIASVFKKRKTGASLPELLISIVITGVIALGIPYVVGQKVLNLDRVANDKNATHGFYECFRDESGNLYQRQVVGNKESGLKKVSSCSFTPPENAENFTIQATGGGGSGAYPYVESRADDNNFTRYTMTRGARINFFPNGSLDGSIKAPDGSNDVFYPVIESWFANFFNEQMASKAIIYTVAGASGGGTGGCVGTGLKSCKTDNNSDGKANCGKYCETWKQCKGLGLASTVLSQSCHAITSVVHSGSSRCKCSGMIQCASGCQQTCVATTGVEYGCKDVNICIYTTVSTSYAKSNACPVGSPFVCGSSKKPCPVSCYTTTYKTYTYSKCGSSYTSRSCGTSYACVYQDFCPADTSVSAMSCPSWSNCGSGICDSKTFVLYSQYQTICNYFGNYAVTQNAITYSGTANNGSSCLSSNYPKATSTPKTTCDINRAASSPCVCPTSSGGHQSSTSACVGCGEDYYRVSVKGAPGEGAEKKTFTVTAPKIGMSAIVKPTIRGTSSTLSTLPTGGTGGSGCSPGSSSAGPAGGHGGNKSAPVDMYFTVTNNGAKVVDAVIKSGRGGSSGGRLECVGSGKYANGSNSYTLATETSIAGGAAGGSSWGPSVDTSCQKAGRSAGGRGQDAQFSANFRAYDYSYPMDYKFSYFSPSGENSTLQTFHVSQVKGKIIVDIKNAGAKVTTSGHAGNNGGDTTITVNNDKFVVKGGYGGGQRNLYPGVPVFNSTNSKQYVSAPIFLIGQATPVSVLNYQYCSSTKSDICYYTAGKTFGAVPDKNNRSSNIKEIVMEKRNDFAGLAVDVNKLSNNNPMRKGTAGRGGSGAHGIIAHTGTVGTVTISLYESVSNATKTNPDIQVNNKVIFEDNSTIPKDEYYYIGKDKDGNYTELGVDGSNGNFAAGGQGAVLIVW